jgi:hypothetical protein
VALPFTLKRRIMAKLKIFHHAKKKNLQNNPLKQNQNPSRYYYNSIITNLKFQTSTKISDSFKKSSYEK